MARRGASTCTACSRGTRIVVNRHIDVAEGYANNMRLYEATGMGALLITDRGRNLGELFEPGRGGGRSTRTPTTWPSKIAGYLADDHERACAWPRAGQARTLQRAHLRAADTAAGSAARGAPQTPKRSAIVTVAPLSASTSGISRIMPQPLAAIRDT